MVVFTAMAYYRRRAQSKISKGKRHMGQTPEEARYKLPRTFSRKRQDTLNSSNNPTVTTCEVLSTREAYQRLSAQGFYWK